MAHDIEDFEAEVVEASREIPVLADFWAAWCGPCRVLGPVLERMAESSEGRWRLAKVNTEEFPQEAARYGVRGIPNVKLFVDGEPVDEFVGALPESQIQAWLDQALPSEADRAGRAAIRELESLVFSDPVAALEQLSELDPPADLQQRVVDLEFVARRLLLLDDPSGLGSGDAVRHYLGGLRRLRDGDLDGGLQQLIASMRDDRSLDDDGARKTCVALFRLLGQEHPAVARCRGDFAGALYV
ncbi:MAG: thioredoxin [Gemmatimonadales bacterium]|nr:MAG: thioredoxin [Gemmatimonadales bacterium]